jgi:hypothetical protein
MKILQQVDTGPRCEIHMGKAKLRRFRSLQEIPAGGAPGVDFERSTIHTHNPAGIFRRVTWIAVPMTLRANFRRVKLTHFGLPPEECSPDVLPQVGYGWVA